MRIARNQLRQIVHENEIAVHPTIADIPHQVQISRRNFVNHLDDNTNILDVPFHIMGTLVGVAPSISFIPDNNKIKKDLRDIFLFFMRKMDSLNEIDAPDSARDAWKRYFLLPVILFDNPRRGNDGRVKDILRERINLISKGDWSSFTLGNLKLKTLFELNNEQISTKEMQKRISKTLGCNAISKAYRILVKDNSRIPQNEWAFNLLESKFPARNEISPLSDEQVHELRNFQPQRVSLEADVDSIREIVMRQGNLISPGFDKFRNEHLKALFGWDDVDPKQNEFRKLYVRIIEKIINGELPDEVRSLYSDSEAFAGPKSDNDIRPLGKINLDRKIAGAILLRKNRNEIRRIFGDVQHGSDPKGTEKIIHSIRLVNEKNPEFDSFFPDAANAFNNSSRDIGLYETMKRIPEMFS